MGAMKNTFTLALVLALLQLLCLSPARAQGGNEHQITQVMKQQFDTPEAPLTVMPISVEGDYAVAGWLQGSHGGRALLQKSKDHWSIALCGGAGLTQAGVLQSTGMQADAANKLARAIQTAEAALGADQRTRFNSFEGMVKIDAAQSHGEHNPHDPHSGHTVPVQK
jgi:hypothetical protein